MSTLFQDGRIIDLILFLVFIELLILTIYNRRTGKGISFLSSWPNLLSGFSLLVSIKLMALSAWWGWLALWLSIALIMHFFDLATRWSN